jgi:hypothetical protein
MRASFVRCSFLSYDGASTTVLYSNQKKQKVLDNYIPFRGRFLIFLFLWIRTYDIISVAGYPIITKRERKCNEQPLRDARGGFEIDCRRG